MKVIAGIANEAKAEKAVVYCSNCGRIVFHGED